MLIAGSNGGALAAPDPFSSEGADLPALVLLQPDSPANLESVAAEVIALGGQVTALFPETAFFARMTPSQAATLRALPGVRSVRSPQDGPAELPDGSVDSGSRAAILAWNARLTETLYPTAAPSNPDRLPEMPANDVLNPLDVPDRGSTDAVDAPEAYQTSLYMLGSAQVDVFLLESNGAIDPNLEDWTPAQIDRVMTEISLGVSWWADTAAVYGGPSAQFNPSIVFHTPLNEPQVVATAYEPITRPSGAENMWIPEVLNHLGYGQGNRFNAVRSYANDRRLAAGHDWGLVIWVINSAADADNRFSDQAFAYSYLNGPYMVMTYGNENWGIDRMEMVTAHEFGHLFGALDEYAAAGCTDLQISGYLGITNTNCENGTPPFEESIMRNADSMMLAYPANVASTPARWMLGWRDSDTDGILDPIDTLTNLLVDQPISFITQDTELTLSGTARDQPFPSPLHNPASINRVAGVQYRLDGGSWNNCAADDGMFDSNFERFTCLPPELTNGDHYLELQSSGRYATFSDPVVETIRVNPVGPPAAFEKSFPTEAAAVYSAGASLEWEVTGPLTEYEYCVDTLDNDTCDTVWTSAGVDPDVSPGVLAPDTTFYWQVRARNFADSTDADGGIWWRFTTFGPPHRMYLPMIR